jgi:hypothetical protein
VRMQEQLTLHRIASQGDGEAYKKLMRDLQ